MYFILYTFIASYYHPMESETTRLPQAISTDMPNFTAPSFVTAERSYQPISSYQPRQVCPVYDV